MQIVGPRKSEFPKSVINKEIKIHVYRKTQTSDSSGEFLRIENKQTKILPNDSYG